MARGVKRLTDSVETIIGAIKDRDIQFYDLTDDSNTKANTPVYPCLWCTAETDSLQEKRLRTMNLTLTFEIKMPVRCDEQDAEYTAKCKAIQGEYQLILEEILQILYSSKFKFCYEPTGDVLFDNALAVGDDHTIVVNATALLQEAYGSVKSGCQFDESLLV